MFANVHHTVLRLPGDGELVREIRLHVCKRPFTARLERLQTCVHAVLASVKMNNCMFANVTLNYKFTFANVNSWSCEARLQTLQ